MIRGYSREEARLDGKAERPGAVAGVKTGIAPVTGRNGMAAGVEREDAIRIGGVPLVVQSEGVATRNRSKGVAERYGPGGDAITPATSARK